MTDSEKQLLKALTSMALQYLGTDDEFLDHMFMSAGERTVKILAKYGLVTEEGRGGRWTEAGKRFIASP